MISPRQASMTASSFKGGTPRERKEARVHDATGGTCSHNTSMQERSQELTTPRQKGSLTAAGANVLQR